MSEKELSQGLIANSDNKIKTDIIINRSMFYAAGAGLIPVPVLDVVTLLATQIYMIKDIAGVYGQEKNFNKNKIKNFIITLVADMGTVGVISGVKFVPIIGSIIGILAAPATAVAATYALGRVFVQHFDQGGTLLDFNPVTSRKYFEKEYEHGKTLKADKLTVSPQELNPEPIYKDLTASAGQTIPQRSDLQADRISALLKKQRGDVKAKMSKIANKVKSSTDLTDSKKDKKLTSGKSKIEKSANKPTEKSAIPKTPVTSVAGIDDYSGNIDKPTDDFNRIEGIGGKVIALLLAGNIDTMQKLADADEDTLKGILRKGGRRYNFIVPNTWPQQARLIVEGKFDELEDLQSKLKGGKVRDTNK